MSKDSPRDCDQHDHTPEGVPIPRFTPWRGRNHDPRGWTAERQRLFIRALARCGSARMAAAMVGKTVRSAYLLRNKPGAASFACAWDQAVMMGYEDITGNAIERAINGEARPTFRNGRFKGVRKVFNDRLMLGLTHARRHRFSDEFQMEASDIFWRLHRWSDELNRTQLDRVDDVAYVISSENATEIEHAHRILEREIKRRKKLEEAKRMRALLKTGEENERQRKRDKRAPSVRGL